MLSRPDCDREWLSFVITPLARKKALSPRWLYVVLLPFMVGGACLGDLLFYMFGAIIGCGVGAGATIYVFSFLRLNHLYYIFRRSKSDDKQ